MAMNNITLNIGQSSDLWQKVENLSAMSNQALDIAISYVKANEDIDFLDDTKQIIINLSLSNDAEVKQLNSQFRNKDKATNVLSFANIDDDNFYNDIEIFDEIELGDIIISYETLDRESAEKQIPFTHHYCHLLIHGILHLLGFDHIEDEEAEYMEEFEIKILEQLNINNPYEE